MVSMSNELDSRSPILGFLRAGVSDPASAYFLIFSSSSSPVAKASLLRLLLASLGLGQRRNKLRGPL